jgi:LPXTG-motif cell wall-anchored protein
MKRAIQQRVRWALGAVVLGASLLASSPSVHAAEGEAYVLSDVQCDTNHNGVLDLTLVNNQALQAAVFVVAAPAASGSSAISVAAASVSAITFTDLADGALTVPVSVDGVDAGVAVRVACDAPEVAVMGAVRQQSATSPSLPATGRSSTGGLVIGSALVVAGIAASLVARRRYS